MKQIYQILSLIGVLLFVGCNHSAQDDGLAHNHEVEQKELHKGHKHDHDHVHNHSHEHVSSNEATQVKQQHNHSDEIVLSLCDANRFGVSSKIVKTQEFNEIIKVSGQIVSAPNDQSVVSAPLSGIVTFYNGIVEGKKVSKGNAIASVSARGVAGGDANEAARIAYEAAKMELERVTPLHTDGIVSTKEYNAKKQAFDQAKAAYTGNSAGSTASSVSNGVITKLLVKQGEYVNAGQPIAVVSGNTRLTLRADLPEKYYSFLPTISTANIRPSYAEDVLSLDKLNGRLISSSSSTSEQPGYIPIYFTFDNNGTLVPGAFVEVFLIGTTRNNVVVLPVDALTEQQGKYYVYVKLDDECYEKRIVTLGNSNGNNVEILSGISPNENVVDKGAIIVKLAESSGSVPQGHNHNH